MDLHLAAIVKVGVLCWPSSNLAVIVVAARHHRSGSTRLDVEQHEPEAAIVSEAAGSLVWPRRHLSLPYRGGQDLSAVQSAASKPL